MHSSVSANSRPFRQDFSSKLVRISLEGALIVVEAFEVIDRVLENRAVELLTDDGCEFALDWLDFIASVSSRTPIRLNGESVKV